MTVLIDAHARDTILDIGRSFLLQAPAGSGKTECLVQRYLALLATVEEPEQVLAITFTRKAAQEMVERVMHALTLAQGPKDAVPAYQKVTYELAKNVLLHAKQLKWDLVHSPGRLSVSTFDAWCAKALLNMPFAMKGLAGCEVTDRPDFLYHHAVESWCEDVFSHPQHQWVAERLLKHLGGRLERLMTLIKICLSTREQWLGLLTQARGDLDHFIGVLEDTLTEIQYLSLGRWHKVVDASLQELLLELTQLAYQNLGSVTVRGIDWNEAPNKDDIRVWQDVGDCFLTKTGTWREVLNIRQGFSTDNHMKEAKSRALVLLKDLQEHPQWASLLSQLRDLPSLDDLSSQRPMIEALVQLLPYAVAHLHVAFAQFGQTDFTERALQTTLALDAELDPSHWLLALDRRLQHVLVDEFQDTSQLQYQLLLNITRGWQLGDGRTVFLVGDPMQSIYRFRQGDVGLFLKVKRSGLGDIPIEFLQLQCNFRSAPEVVNWCNMNFSQLFPQRESMLSAAVCFSASTPAQSKAGQVNCCWIAADENPNAETQALLKRIVHYRQTQPDASIAVLVRARSHLQDLVKGLRAKGLPCQAREIESFYAQPLVRDLLTLSYALDDLADEVSWFALLATPWCGFSSDDLLKLSTHRGKRLTWPALNNSEIFMHLSEHAQSRWVKTQPVLALALENSGRKARCEQVQVAWLGLGGALGLTAFEKALAQQFFNALSHTSLWQNRKRFEQYLASLHAPSIDSASGAIELMTIHKSKGLEFDVVLLMALNRGSGRSDAPLMRWQAVPLSGQRQGLLFSSMAAGDQVSAPLLDYLQGLNAEQEDNELLRLFYVACTRARNHLECFATIEVNEAGEPKLAAGSLLKKLWPALAEDEQTILSSDASVDSFSSYDVDDQVMRIRHDWTFIDEVAGHTLLPFTHTQANPAGRNQPILPLIDRQARAVGTVIHECLAAIVQNDWAIDEIPRHIDARQLSIGARLSALGVGDADIAQNTQAVRQAIDMCMHDEKGQWLLFTQHVQSFCEYPIWHKGPYGQLVRSIIDRLIFDQGQWWVIDYKTGHYPAGVDAQEKITEQYRPQVSRYQQVLLELGMAPVRTALYFVNQAKWVEIKLQSHAQLNCEKSIIY